jgi:hypothetical protein
MKNERAGCRAAIQQRALIVYEALATKQLFRLGA